MRNFRQLLMFLIFNIFFFTSIVFSQGVGDLVELDQNLKELDTNINQAVKQKPAIQRTKEIEIDGQGESLAIEGSNSAGQGSVSLNPDGTIKMKRGNKSLDVLGEAIERNNN